MLPLLLGLAQAPDARMAARATLERPRLTYAEFGAWTQNRTGLPVTVAAAIRERKATVLVADRPVRETMARFAETFGLEWERTAGGLALRLDPKVAREERAVLDAEAERAEAGLRADLEAAMTLGRLSPEALAARLEEAGATSDAEGESRHFRLERIGRDGALLAAGEALAGLSPEARGAVIGGHRVFADASGRPGLAAVSTRWMPAIVGNLEGAGDPDAPRPVPTALRLVLKGDPARQRVLASVTVLGADGVGFLTQETRFEHDDLLDDERSPLARRLAAWATREPALLATPLRADATPMPAHSSTRHTLADALVALHRRSGLPILADGFREAAFAGEAPGGATLGAWLAGVDGFGVARSRPPLVRAAGGWLGFRHPTYWRRLGAEPSERAIVALERSTSGLDGLAAFAAGLTPVQEGHLDADELVMDVPNEAVESNVPFLRTWAALSAGQRRRAFAEAGLPLAGLSGDARERLLDALGDLEGDTEPGDAILPYLLPGGPALPGDLTLSVEAKDAMETTEFPAVTRQSAGRAEALRLITREYAGFGAEIAGAGQAFRIYRFPLRPKGRETEASSG